jgi:S-DNA-T family DNA segregation ATPase FtsK/SpoIIIE
MSRKKTKKFSERAKESHLKPEVKKTVFAIILLSLGIILIFAGFNQAGFLGDLVYRGLDKILGWGYYFLSAFLIIAGLVLLASEEYELTLASSSGALILILSFLAIVDIIFPGKAGLAGGVSKIFTYFFDKGVGLFAASVTAVVSFVIAFNAPLKIRLPKKEKLLEEKNLPSIKEAGGSASPEETPFFGGGNQRPDPAREKHKESAGADSKEETVKLVPKKISFKNYVPPPISLLRTSCEKPTAGDLRANANIIKRALDGFGIPVEMGEITIGPKVTRYTLKPAEGVKLSRITALNQDLALALAAHPLRIEAPIPGKSLVGIEVPNKTAAIVRLGSLISYPEFTTSGNLTFALGRDIAGQPIFPNIAKMPHLLIAGSTGSGKSVVIHSLIVSLLSKNSPETLRLILIDPKKIELSIYADLPHLVSPVIIEGKKAVGALRFAINEMEERYETLLRAGSRDIGSYNANRKENLMPYLIIIIDELADLMAAYGREVEGSIVRLAQMARATGIHLVVSTQRPSVEVITGLIKANITTRVALQVASQVDSRTILDSAGAEKLLGGGDMLFVSAEFSKPKRIQGSYISEEETKAVAKFVAENNEEGEITEIEEKASAINETLWSENGGDDELYDEAVRVVIEAKKASASLLQRRLKVGYARAARLLDIMETKGLISPGEGAKPREVYLEKNENE